MANYVLSDTIFTQEEIEKRAAEIAEEINRDYAGETVVFIGILRGAVMWLSQLIKSINLDAEIDFMDVSSYGAATKSSGIVKIEKDLDNTIEDKNVIIVEDIVDSGVTLNYLREYLLAMNPKSLKICALLDKPTGRRSEIDADYVGFTVGDVFIVGYGLDVNQKYRQLPYITSVAVEE
jgi:hypoxanthine phosphoribosyltransferase